LGYRRTLPYVGGEESLYVLRIGFEGTFRGI